MAKRWWKSRVLWWNGVFGLATIIPSAKLWIHQHPVAFLQFSSLYNFIMRFDTKHPISTGGEKEQT